MKILLLLLPLALAQSPGLQAGVSLAAIQGFKNQAIPAFLSQVGIIDIPGQSAQLDLSIDAQVSNIQLSNLRADPTNTQVIFSPPDLVGAEVAGLELSVTFDWSFTSDLGDGQGSGYVSINSSALAANVTVGARAGHCILLITGASMVIGELEVTFQGDPLADVADWILDLFRGHVKELIEQAIESAVLIEGQQALDGQLSQFSIYVPIGNTGISINYDLVEEPVVQPTFISVASLAMFVDSNNPNSTPPVAPPAQLPVFDVAGQQIQIIISDFTLNTGLYAAAMAGRLQYTITPDLVPASFPLKLDTTYLNALFPGIEAKYGANQPCSIECSASPPPSVSTTPGDLSGVATGSCLLFTQNTQVLGLAITLDFSAAVSLANWEVHAQILSVEVSSVEAFNSTLTEAVNTDGLAYTLNVALRLVAPVLDSTYLATGITLPHIENLNLNEGEVTLGAGFVQIQATPLYNLTRLEVA